MPVTPPFEEDLLGTNPNNRISNEEFNIPVSPSAVNRIIIPRHGPFFAESAVLISSNLGINTILSRGTDFEFIEPSTAAWKATGGKEIFLGVVVKNNALPPTFSFSYNTIGGLYAFDARSLHDMLNAILNSPANQSVNWETNILNKPVVFTPTPHLQSLDSIYGFGPLTVALERVSNAISIGNAPALQNVIDYFNARLDNITGGGGGFDVAGHNADINAHSTMFASKANAHNAILTGTPTTTNPNISDYSARIASTQFVKDVTELKADIHSPSFTGAPTSPTVPVSDNSTKIATTAFVKEALSELSARLSIGGGAREYYMSNIT